MTSMFIQVIGAIFVIKTCIRVRVHEFINLADAVLPSKVEFLSFWFSLVNGSHKSDWFSSTSIFTLQIENACATKGKGNILSLYFNFDDK